MQSSKGASKEVVGLTGWTAALAEAIIAALCEQQEALNREKNVEIHISAHGEHLSYRCSPLKKTTLKWHSP